MIVLIGFGATATETFEIQTSAIETVDLSPFLSSHSNIWAKNVCLSSVVDVPQLDLMLAKTKCSDANTTYSNITVTSNGTFQDEGLLFYWLNETIFDLNVLIFSDSTPVYVYILNSTEKGVGDFESQCESLQLSPEVTNPTTVNPTWIFQPNTTHCDDGFCRVSKIIKKSSYYYICIKGSLADFYLRINSRHYDYDLMDTCKAEKNPCCKSYENLFNEIKSSTCMYLVSNVIYDEDSDEPVIQPEFLVHPNKVKLQIKIGLKWWLFVVSILGLAAIISACVCSIFCCLTIQKEQLQNVAWCCGNHACVCPCYPLRYRLQYEAID